MSLSFNMKDFSDKITGVIENKYVSGALLIILISYATLAAPKLPPHLVSLVENKWIQLLFLAALAYLTTKDYTVALITAVVFVLTVNTLQCKSIKSQLNSYIYSIPYARQMLSRGSAAQVGPQANPKMVPIMSQDLADDDSMYDPEYTMNADVSTYPMDGNKIAIETANDEGYYVNPPSYGGGLYSDLTKHASIGSGAVGGYDPTDNMNHF